MVLKLAYWPGYNIKGFSAWNLFSVGGEKIDSVNNKLIQKTFSDVSKGEKIEIVRRSYNYVIFRMKSGINQKVRSKFIVEIQVLVSTGVA